MRFGTVAIVGRTNVGKSTLLNAALGEELAIVSPLPQTTREALLGVAEHKDAQIAFLDTPGLHRPRSELGRRMNATALEAARAADLLVFMTDVASLVKSRGSSSDVIAQGDLELLALVPKEQRCILVLNKVDLLRDKSRLLPLFEAFGKCRDFLALVPVSVAKRDGVDRVLDEIVALLPEGLPGYDADTLTDRGPAYFVREYVREQVLRNAGAEVPHAAAVSIDSLQDDATLLVARATLHIEKIGQRKILIGEGGSRIKAIGTEARKRLEQLFQKKVHLELFVRVTPAWKDTPRQLVELGYDKPSDRNLANALPDATRTRSHSSGAGKKRTIKAGKPAGKTRTTDKPGQGNSPRGGNRASGAKPGGNRASGAKPGSNRAGGAKPGGNRAGGAKPGGNRASGAKPGGNRAARPGGARNSPSAARQSKRARA